MNIRDTVIEALDLVGSGWGVPTYDQRGNMTELVTNRALDLTAACRCPPPGVKRLLLLSARRSGSNRRLVRLVVQDEGGGLRVLVHDFTTAALLVSSLPVAAAADQLGIGVDILRKAIRWLQDDLPVSAD